MATSHDWRMDMSAKDYTICKLFDHPYVLKTYSYCDNGLFHESDKLSSNVAYQITEYCTGDLLGVMLNCSQFTEQIAAHFFEMLISAVSHIHSHKVSHQDIKAERCYVNENYEIKLGGFLFATQNMHIVDEFGGTLPYISPEKLNGIPFNPYLVDIFACGVILYMMLTGYMPFKLARPDDQYYRHMYSDKSQFWLNRKGISVLSLEVEDLIMRMLEPNPTARIKIEDILQHPWLAKHKGMSHQKFVEEVHRIHK